MEKASKFFEKYIFPPIECTIYLNAFTIQGKHLCSDIV